MGKKSRDKGLRREREVRDLFNSIPGVMALRVPLSGASEGFKGDIQVFIPDGCTNPAPEYRAEVKGRALCKWKQIKEWLGENDLLILVEDRSEALVVVPWSRFAKLVARGGVSDVCRNETGTGDSAKWPTWPLSQALSSEL